MYIDSGAMRSHLDRALRRLILMVCIAIGGTATIVCGAGNVHLVADLPSSLEEDSSWGEGDEWARGLATAPPGVRFSPEGAAGTRILGADDTEDDDLAPGSVIEDDSQHAMDAFYETLSRVEREAEVELIARLACYGDSHTAADFMTGQLRRRLQARFGDAGHGFVAAGRPWPSYRHRDIRSGSRGRWHPRRIRHAARRGESDGLLGMAGVGVESEASGPEIWVSTVTEGPVGRSASKFELFYLAQPQGGRFGVYLDDELVARVSTRADRATPGYFAAETEDGAHRYRVESLGGGPVRLFGTIVERAGPGVVVDSMGINGARVTQFLAWDEEFFRDNLNQRETDLVVLLYGANSVGDDWYNIEQYGQWVIDAMTRVRRSLPDASCLWVGPPDMARATLAYSGPDGTPPAIHRIIEAQRDAAGLVGCAYFDSFQAMGGEDSNLRWAEQDPSLVSPDGIHFTAPGYRLLGDMLYEALIDGYEHYLEAHPEETASETGE